MRETEGQTDTDRVSSIDFYSFFSLSLNAQVKSQAYFGPGTGRIAYDDVTCAGTETDLSQCRHARLSDCTHSEDVGVICQITSSSGRLYVQSPVILSGSGLR